MDEFRCNKASQCENACYHKQPHELDDVYCKQTCCDYSSMGNSITVQCEKLSTEESVLIRMRGNQGLGLIDFDGSGIDIAWFKRKTR